MRYTSLVLAVLMGVMAVGIGTAQADDMSQCSAVQGTYLVGTIVQGPQFWKAKQTLHGVSLSHTRLTIMVDGKPGTYDVAIDNVFAADYVKASHTSPVSLMALKVGDHLELCGKAYPAPETGIDWVHTNCGNSPTPNTPDGWVKVIGQDGHPGVNLESSQQYCYLWPQQKTH